MLNVSYQRYRRKIEVGNAETLSITGGAMEPLTEGNIGVVNDGTKGLKLNYHPNFPV